jgi:hypothetical protein
MLPLRPETQAVIEQLVALSGTPLEFMRDPGLSVLASLQIARHGAPYHVLRYRPSNDSLDYIVAQQVGFVMRMFALPADLRVDFAATGEGEESMRDMIRASTSPSQADTALLPEFAKQVHQWALMQVRSIPIGMRVDAWLYRDYESLHELQALGLASQQQMNANLLGQRVGGLSAPVAQLAPAAAFALFTDRLLGTQRYAIPFEAAGVLAEGRTLLETFDATPDDPAHDRELVDCWADKLGMRGWYRWVPYKP